MQQKLLVTKNYFKLFQIGVLIICMFNNTYGQTFTGSGGAIYDDSLVIFTQNITIINTDKLRPQYGLQSVEINVNHTYLQNLEISLMAPAALKSRKRFGGGVLEPTHFIEIHYELPKIGAWLQVVQLRDLTCVDFPADAF